MPPFFMKTDKYIRINLLVNFDEKNLDTNIRKVN